jgi:hypothetical protein
MKFFKHGVGYTVRCIDALEDLVISAKPVGSSLEMAVVKMNR